MSGVAAFLVAVVALVLVLSSASSAAPNKRRSHQAGTGNAGLSQAEINANVNRLIGEMTVAEKFGQLDDGRSRRAEWHSG